MSLLVQPLARTYFKISRRVLRFCFEDHRENFKKQSKCLRLCSLHCSVAVVPNLRASYPLDIKNKCGGRKMTKETAMQKNKTYFCYFQAFLFSCELVDKFSFLSLKNIQIEQPGRRLKLWLNRLQPAKNVTFKKVLALILQAKKVKS